MSELHQICVRADIPRRLTILAFAMLDDFNREGLGIEVDFSLPAERVVGGLSQILEWRGKPPAIRVDNGPEYVSLQIPRQSAP